MKEVAKINKTLTWVSFKPNLADTDVSAKGVHAVGVCRALLSSLRALVKISAACCVRSLILCISLPLTEVWSVRSESIATLTGESHCVVIVVYAGAVHAVILGPIQKLIFVTGRLAVTPFALQQQQRNAHLR